MTGFCALRGTVLRGRTVRESGTGPVFRSVRRILKNSRSNLFGRLSSLDQKNFLCIAAIALSASATGTSTDIFISLVEIMFMFIFAS